MIHFIVAVMLVTATPVVKDTLSGAVISSSLKQTLTKNEIAVPVTSLAMKEIEAAGLASPKNLAGIVPGLAMPDYGSSMTSTIYVRGIGSRMENPVIGLYIDDVPVLDKNCYDFHSWTSGGSTCSAVLRVRSTGAIPCSVSWLWKHCPRLYGRE